MGQHEVQAEEMEQEVQAEEVEQVQVQVDQEVVHSRQCPSKCCISLCHNQERQEHLSSKVKESLTSLGTCRRPEGQRV